MFRGYLFTRIQAILPTGRAAVLAAFGSAALFGWAHLSQGIVGAVDNLVFGLVLSALYLISRRNLWLPILTHGAVDTIGLFLIFMGAYP